jgi:hypothetical protein
MQPQDREGHRQSMERIAAASVLSLEPAHLPPHLYVNKHRQQTMLNHCALGAK